jgi:4-hydroxy-tetrahydrodipicolinate synthase
MAGTGNVMPTEIVAVFDAVQSGNLKEAREAWDRIYPLIDAMMAQPFVPAVKTALAAAGFPAGPPRAPLIALDSAPAARITELVSALPSVRAS